MKTKSLTAALVIALLAFLLLPTFALAQTSTARVPPPACWPAQVGGSGSKAVRVTGDYGQAIMWWCGQEAVGLVSSWAYTMVIPDKLPANLTDALKLMWEVNVSNEPIDEIQRAQLKQDAMIALDPLRPVAPRWIVAPNGTFPTRPVYLYTEATAADGTKQRTLTATTHRVNVKNADGTPNPCACGIVSYPASSSVTYCAVNGLPTVTGGALVAVCRVQ